MRTLSRRVIALMVTLFVLTMATGAFAHIIVPRPEPPIMPMPPIPPPPFGLTLQSLSVEASVTDGIAEVTVDQRFVNKSDMNAEGTYLFPLPAGAVIGSFNLLADGETFGGELLTADEARRIYKGIVARIEILPCFMGVEGNSNNGPIASIMPLPD